jgi:hypothetical protein
LKFDRIPTRRLAPFVASACALAVLSGCMSSPTYGTDKTANQQLVADVTGVLGVEGLTGASSKQAEIAYTPRGQLVKPASLEVLPEPQQAMASAENPAWPESPEERRRRIRAEATENDGKPGYRSPIMSRPSDTAFITDAQRAEIQRIRRETNQGEATNRRYLSEPPLEYRVPEATAEAGELGEPEWKKAQRAKRASGKSSWRDLLPW